jgi:ABC-type branched-subunit amino acid transport system ATPase component
MNPKETEELHCLSGDQGLVQVTVFLIEHHMNLVMDISDNHLCP